jgi:hypothetical protein
MSRRGMSVLKIREVGLDISFSEERRRKENGTGHLRNMAN